MTRKGRRHSIDDHATAARSGIAAAGTERRSSRSVRQKAEPPLRKNDGSGVVATW
jgi:hypothetical protein